VRPQPVSLFACLAWFAVRGNRGCCGSQIRAPLASVVVETRLRGFNAVAVSTLLRQGSTWAARIEIHRVRRRGSTALPARSGVQSHPDGPWSKHHYELSTRLQFPHCCARGGRAPFLGIRLARAVLCYLCLLRVEIRSVPILSHPWSKESVRSPSPWSAWSAGKRNEDGSWRIED
jgi:hypothetical protein